MRVNSLKTLGFRNLCDGEYAFDPGVNVIFGNNAQGKTNLIEAVWLFTGNKSFRGSKDADLIKLGQSGCSVALSFDAQGRSQQAVLRMGEERSVSLNSVQLRSAAKLAGKFCAVVFSPLDVGLISDGPSERRRFLDNTLCQLKPKYANALAEYTRAVQQRSTVLRDVRYHSELEGLLDVYEAAAASAGAYIVKTRQNYVNFILPSAQEYYAGISSGKERLWLSYEPTVPQSDTKEGLAAALKAARADDVITGNTSVGPHRDDLAVSINGLAARVFGSQGQKRSAALSLKLAEAGTMMTFANEPPVILLDDVMSELDSGRKKFVLNSLGERQIFITCCARGDLRGLKAGKVFKMTDGELRRIKQG